MRARSGFLPVAKALGAGSRTMATLGIGRPAAIVTSWIKLKSLGLSDSCISLAPVIASTNLSAPK